MNSIDGVGDYGGFRPVECLEARGIWCSALGATF